MIQSKLLGSLGLDFKQEKPVGEEIDGELQKGKKKNSPFAKELFFYWKD